MITPITAPISIRLQSMLFWITPCASAEISPACGAGSGCSCVGAGRAGEAVGVIEQIQDRRNDRRAGDHADDQRHCCFARRRVDQLAGLEVLQVVVGDGGDGEHDRRDEQREGDQRLFSLAGRSGLMPNDQQQRRADHDQDADARQRAVRRADQAGHVAAHRRDDRSP